MIAEDLGFLTEDVRQLRDDSGFPGMKVLEFAFDTDSSNEYLPHTYPANTVCYTGTHDNMPLKQWFAESDEKTVAFAKTYMGEPENPIWGMIRLCMASVSELAVVQMQDYLELGSEARMNFPGTRTSSNWTWRATGGYLYPGLAQRIHRLTKIYGRLAEKEETGEEE
jgi:4-alpha-glucanotransferase